VRVAQPDGIFAPLQRLDIPAPFVRVAVLRSAVDEDVHIAGRLAQGRSARDDAWTGRERETGKHEISKTAVHGPSCSWNDRPQESCTPGADQAACGTGGIISGTPPFSRSE